MKCVKGRIVERYYYIRRGRNESKMYDLLVLIN